MYSDIIRQVNSKTGGWKKARKYLLTMASLHRYSANCSYGYVRQFNNKIANEIERSIK
jgi:hypothetical protein